ncbi:MAG: tRNA nucleotidyltransferase [Coriobacteriia bacterium]|nr:tRNA nucleotidyltransferase [Coriobacteriia bacterium]
MARKKPSKETSEFSPATCEGHVLVCGGSAASKDADPANSRKESAKLEAAAALQRDLAMARTIARLVDERGGRTFFVGGCVRDKLMGIQAKDLDLEVHGIEPACLRELLEGLGHCSERGASFGILALDGYGLDIAQPRRERAIGVHHTDFEVDVDPFIGTYEAAIRRDFTINALMEDVLTGEVIDHFNGVADLQAGILRHVSEASFAEDPLRVLRAAQFAARFEFKLAPETISLCSTMDLTALSKERVMGELEKALLKAERPSLFFETLREMEQLDTWFPEVAALVGVQQPPQYHPEGDVWAHTMCVIDQAVKSRDQATWPLAFMLAALAHDFGKPATTELIDGRWRAFGHENEGVAVAHVFIRRLTAERKLATYVESMVKLHMRPNAIVGCAKKAKSFNRLFDSSVSPEDLLLIAKSDYLGCGGTSAEAYSKTEEALRGRLADYRELMARPHVTGEDLIKAGLKPGPQFSEALAYAHKMRLAGIAKERVLQSTLGYVRTLK